MAPEAGYSGTPLPRKLGIKPGHEVAVLGGPAGVAASLTGLPGVAPPRRDLSGSDPLDVIVYFVTWRADLEEQLATLRGRMAPAAGLWIAWPKRASRVPTDMTEHVIRVGGDPRVRLRDAGSIAQSGRTGVAGLGVDTREVNCHGLERTEAAPACDRDSRGSAYDVDRGCDQGSRW